jgi:hypothetical protein
VDRATCGDKLSDKRRNYCELRRSQDARDRRDQSDVIRKATARRRARRKITARRRANKAKDAKKATLKVGQRYHSCTLSKNKSDHSVIRTTHCRCMIAHAGSLRNDQTLVELQACLYMMPSTIYTYRLIYLRTIHYSPRSFFILLLISLLALPFFSYV